MQLHIAVGRDDERDRVEFLSQRETRSSKTLASVNIRFALDSTALFYLVGESTRMIYAITDTGV